MMPYWPDVHGAPQNSIIGGATLWVLRDRPRAEYNGVAKFFAYLSKPEVQAAWHQNTGYLPITRAAFDLTRAQGFYDRNPGAAISIEQMTLKPPTENSKGIRLGSFVLIRDVDRRRTGAGLQRQEDRRRRRSISRSSAATACCASSSAPIRIGQLRHCEPSISAHVDCFAARNDGIRCRALVRISRPSAPGAPNRRNGCRWRSTSRAATA